MLDWQDHYLWAGLILLGVNLIHFAAQRKLRDQNTVIFFRQIILGILICVFGILLGNQSVHLNAVLSKAVMAGAYLVQAWLPYELLCFIATRLRHDPVRQRRIRLFGLIPVILSAGIIVLNIPFGFLSTLSGDGTIERGVLYPYFVNASMLYALFDLSYLWAYRKELGGQNWRALLEACIILLAGLFIQYYLNIEMFFGFTVALSLSLIHLTLKSPYAYLDPRTHVFNTQYFNLWMSEQFDLPGRGGLIAVELKQLDRISRLYEDELTVELIQQVSGFLWKLNPAAPVFRLTPERFVIWAARERDAQQCLQACLQYLGHPVQIEGVSIRCPATLARISLDMDLAGVDELNAYIDFLLGQGDHPGETQVVASTPALLDRFSYELEVERFLTDALEQDLFQVWYQPVYSLRRRRYVALEALSRLKHPQLGWISPELFIRIAARSGLLTRIMPGQLRRVCQFVRAHQELFSASIRNVKLNLSPQELADPGYCKGLLDIIQEYNLPFSYFQFEVTESSATQYSQEVEACVSLLQKAGVGLCLDDFGSGYANLNTVLRLPFSVIKMDRSLLFGLCEDQSVATFYRNLVSVLLRMGYHVISEGVETQQDVQRLAAWGVDLIQGYYFSRPLPPEEVAGVVCPGP